MKKILVICLVIFLCLGCTKTKKTFSIGLHGNSSTGYSWNYKFSNDGILKETNKTYTPDNNNPEIDGVGGVYKYYFEALKEGKTTLYFEYYRVFENDIEPLYGYAYEITVDKNLNISYVNVTGKLNKAEAPKLIIE